MSRPVPIAASTSFRGNSRTTRRTPRRQTIILDSDSSDSEVELVAHRPVVRPSQRVIRVDIRALRPPIRPARAIQLPTGQENAPQAQRVRGPRANQPPQQPLPPTPPVQAVAAPTPAAPAANRPVSRKRKKPEGDAKKSAKAKAEDAVVIPVQAPPAPTQQSGISCCVCLDSYGTENHQFGSTLCGHIYCVGCIDEIMKLPPAGRAGSAPGKICAVCRCRLTKKSFHRIFL